MENVLTFNIILKNITLYNIILDLFDFVFIWSNDIVYFMNVIVCFNFWYEVMMFVTYGC